MLKKDIKPTERYVVVAPSRQYLKSSYTVIAEAVEVGVVRDGSRGGVRASRRADGVRVRLCEPWPVQEWKDGRYEDVLLEEGHEYVVQTTDVQRPVDEMAERQAAARARGRELHTKIDEAFTALFMPRARAAGRGGDPPRVPGYEIVQQLSGKKGATVEIDAEVLMSWLERVDPVEAAERVTRAVYAGGPKDRDEWEEALDAELHALRGDLAQER